ncbi:PopZ family protein [Chelativorans sp. YIM 93263]|uniref:PopZ family protein n=1 Tax=Chelativorans sp. YIM 93263 TaxID=2906648 RepID=UPI002379D30F|nr:DUF2497 domain-containing protein [Chelativorans sp. YIM 93263]
MAQASSIQREPSMEEILASIRRIIEDNDTGAKDAESDPASAAPSAEPSGEAEAFRPELKPVPETPAESAEPETPTESHVSRKSTENYNDWPMGEPRVNDDVLMESLAAADAHPQGNFASSSPFNLDRPERRASETEESLAAAMAANTETKGETGTSQAIVSEASGRQVAAAFQELNEALQANRRKSLDQMAEEMLRPMLQEWLDNNLPRLVERLVREEIERIARGE